MDVYLIEPDALRRTVYERYLHALGYTVSVGGQALPEQAGDPHVPPDIVIADLSGSGRRPLSLLASLHTRFPGIPSILLLGVEQDVTSDEAMRCGAKAILRDPVHLEDLGLHVAVSVGNVNPEHELTDNGSMQHDE